MAIRKIVSRSITDGAITTGDLAAGSLSSAGLDITGAGGTGSALLPKGTTAQRPASPVIGYIRYNTTTDCYEQYTSLGWAGISAPPAINSISPTSFNGEQGTTITVNGANFSAGAIVTFINSSNVAYNAAVTTFVNSSQLTATIPQDFTVADEPLDVKVTNANGLSTTLADSLDCGSSPSWTTAAGNVFDGPDDTISATIAATDPDSGSTIAYGATGLPAGVSINSSTGAITGSLSTPVSSATTYSFTGSATDNAGNANTRSFNIITRPTLDTAASYPLSGSNFTLYTNAWTGSSSNLYDLAHANSTFRVPANVYAIRVLVWGCGSIQNSGTGGAGGFTSAILRVNPLEYYKVIVGGGGTIGSGIGGNGANGMGGGSAQDSNDISVGGAGSGFFYAANSGGTTVTDEATMFTKGVLIAGGGGGGGTNGAGGGGNAGGSATSFTISGVSGFGIAGGAGGGGGNNGARYTGQGGDLINNSSGVAATGGLRGFAGTAAQEGFGSGYYAGAGSGAGAGGTGGGNSASNKGEDATGDGGRGRSNYTNNLNTSGPGLGGQASLGDSMGGNGFRFNNINLGAGAAAGHGASQAGGGWSSGGSHYYNNGGGGGSGIAFGYMSGTTPTLSSWANPTSITVAGGNANSICGVPTTAGTVRTLSSGSGYNGAVLIMW